MFFQPPKLNILCLTTGFSGGRFFLTILFFFTLHLVATFVTIQPNFSIQIGQFYKTPKCRMIAIFCWLFCVIYVNSYKKREEKFGWNVTDLLFFDGNDQPDSRHFGRGGKPVFLVDWHENVIACMHLSQTDITVKVNRCRTAKENQPFACGMLAPVGRWTVG